MDSFISALTAILVVIGAITAVGLLGLVLLWLSGNLIVEHETVEDKDAN